MVKKIIPRFRSEKGHILIQDSEVAVMEQIAGKASITEEVTSRGKIILKYSMLGCAILINIFIPLTIFTAFLFMALNLSIISLFAEDLLQSGENFARLKNIRPFFLGLVIIPMLGSLHEQIIAVMGNMRDPTLTESTLGMLLGNKTFELLVSFGVLGYMMCNSKVGCIQITANERRDVIQNSIMMIAGSVLLFTLVYFDQNLLILDGIILVAFYLIFLSITYITRKKDSLASIENLPKSGAWKEFGKMLVALVVIIILSDGVVNDFIHLNFSIPFFARYSFIFLGIAIGLPALIISVIGLRRGKSDIVIGLNIGSAVWETSISIAVLALSNPLAQITTFGITLLLVGLVVSAITATIYLRTKWRLALWESVTLIIIYGVILAAIFLLA